MKIYKHSKLKIGFKTVSKNMMPLASSSCKHTMRNRLNIKPLVKRFECYKEQII
jgi:hypothetical protein